MMIVRPGINRFKDNPDLAMLGDNVGGIDFNANNLHMKTQGEEIKFTFPSNLQGIIPNSIDGVIPVIINIIPITNFSTLLGLNEEKEEPALSLL